MALLVDRIRAFGLRGVLNEQQKQTSQAILDSTAPVYEISNVAEYIKTSGKNDFMSIESFPNVAPLHAKYWMDWSKPEDLLSFGLTRSPERVAVLFHTDGDMYLHEKFDLASDKTSWPLGASVWGGWHGQPPMPLCTWGVRMFKDGSPPEIYETIVYEGIVGDLSPFPRASNDELPIILPDVGSLEEARQRVIELNEVIVTEEARAKESLGKLDELMEVWLRFAVLHPALMAHSFLGCKNVATINNTPAPKLSKSFKKRHGNPLTTYKTLVITPMGSKAARRGTTHIDQALHIVRGHFKTFTKEKPLFGRAVGTYWWSPGLRGKEEHGVVVKDYRVKM